MSLNDWVNNGWLSAHQTSAEEIRNLLAVCDRDIRDCKTEGLSPDWQMNIAYNAALQAATAALAACGYRASREAHHYRVIQTLVHTIGAEKDLVIQFDQFRKKRNIGGYEQAGLVSKKESLEMFKLAVELRNRVQLWLQASYPKLL